MGVGTTNSDNLSIAMVTTRNWTTVAESKYPWERDALEFVRQKFPAHEPYRAWANFEFIADDGSINEVDLLLFTPMGFFLVEIKSRPGRLFGDAGTWTWETEGRLSTVDSPLIAANLKAKKLRSLLQRQKACQKKGPDSLHRGPGLLLGPRSELRVAGQRPPAGLPARPGAGQARIPPGRGSWPR